MVSKFIKSFVVIFFSNYFFEGLCPSPTVTQTARGSWTDGGNSYSIWDTQIVNHGDETLLYVSLEIEGNLLQFWEIVEVSSSMLLN